MSLELSQTARELIQKARIVSFAAWGNQYSTQCIALLQAADDEGRYLTDADLAQLESEATQPDSIQLAQSLRDQAATLVETARRQVLAQFPNITAPGGGLYPAARAEACWRDFWHFLRCITYGIAAQRTDYTSTEGLHFMQLLYQELNVPLDAMLVGLKALKATSLQQFPDLDRPMIAPYFDHLIACLSQFDQSETTAAPV
jgi:hypothetical protein